MKKEILVIVKNKLKSIDTSLPILIELKEKYNISSIVVVNDKLAHKGINENVVIRDAINYVGRELYTDTNSTNKISRKIRKLGFLFFLLFKLMKGTKVLHFGIFNVFPFIVLGKIFSKNLYLLQGSSFKHSYVKFNKVAKKTPAAIVTPGGGNIVAFNDAMKYLDVASDSQKIFMFGSARVRSAWLGYINERSEGYFDNYHGDVDSSNGCIVLILAYFEELNLMRKPNDSATMLLRNTLEVLNKVKGDLPVFIKPHVFTNLDIVNTALHGLKGFHITYLHPSVLASRARVFICNTYSTIMADAKTLGVETVEYSDYSDDTINLSRGKSIGYEYVDKFINNDKNEFEKIIKSILSTKAPHCNSLIADDTKSGANALFYSLAEEK